MIVSDNLHIHSDDTLLRVTDYGIDDHDSFVCELRSHNHTLVHNAHTSNNDSHHYDVEHTHSRHLHTGRYNQCRDMDTFRQRSGVRDAPDIVPRIRIVRETFQNSRTYTVDHSSTR